MSEARNGTEPGATDPAGGRDGGKRPSTPSLMRSLLDWARGASLAPYVYATGCCAVEIEAAWGPRGDLARLGGWTPRATPEHSDVLIVGATVNARQARFVRRVYARMSAPKWVVSVGDCSCEAGLGPGYAGLTHVRDLLPVDVEVPGCPPHPDAIVEGLRALQSRITHGRAGRVSWRGR